MKIINVQGREIFDSRGYPALECQLTLENETMVLASVPSGASRGSHEALELRDGDKRLSGKGLKKAIINLENIIAPLLIGKEPNVFEMDKAMLECDGTPNKEHLGANTMLAASIAVVRAQAYLQGMELYEHIARLYGSQTVSLPFPMINMINGGAHADNGLRIQEYMIMPIQGQNFREAFESATHMFHILKRLLQENDKGTGIGDEGGFAPLFEHEFEALDYLVQAMEESGCIETCGIALDVAASQFYDPAKKEYDWNGTTLSSEGMIELYLKLVDQYPIFSIEDGLAEDDWEGWINLTRALADKIQLVGDDIFVTNPNRIMHGIKANIGSAVIIKPNQIGTVTQTLQALQLCQQQGFGTIVSHRSGETEDTFIADLAVGTSAGQIKSGGCCRSERIAKYNRLLRIEDQLMQMLLSV